MQTKPNRPSSVNEIQKKLAAGEQFRQIEWGSGDILRLKKTETDLDDLQVFRLYSNNRLVTGVVIFITNDGLHKVESTAIFNISPVVRTQDLFFVEIEFIQ